MLLFYWNFSFVLNFVYCLNMATKSNKDTASSLISARGRMKASLTRLENSANDLNCKNDI